MRSLPFLINSLLATTSPTKSSRPVLIEVCLSPGCVADGAEETLNKCMAFVPSDLITVKKGVCVSACGNGPVVRENEKFVHKRVSDVLSLFEKVLVEEKNFIAEEIVEGYKIVSDAKDAAEEKNFDFAIVKYEEGIKLALDSAIEFSKRDPNYTVDGDMPSNLQWIVQAYCDLAEANRQMKEYDRALGAIQEACELSRKTDPLCWELMAQVCQECNDSEKEMKALQNLFAIPVPEGAELPRDVANRRRTQGFRLAKLERESVKS